MKHLKINLLIAAALIVLGSCSKKVGTGGGGTTPPVTPPVVVDSSKEPPYQWKEHWHEHTQLVTRMYVDSNVAVYYDNDVNRNVTWPFQFLSKVWGYVKNTYGDFGKKVGQDDRLFGIYHTDKYGGGSPASYINEDHDFRNILDVGESGGASAWQYAEGWNIGASVHEIGHIVEGATNGVSGSPAFGIWGDSKWAEIFVYDVYKGIGLQQEATQTHDETIDISDSYPREATQWFRDWFLPMYEQYGGAKVFDRYFKLLAANFPKSPFQTVYKFDRDMTMGEFIHFMSGAAGVNLQPMAAKAFGWPAAYTAQLQHARQQFTGITYTGIGDALVTPLDYINVTAIGTLTVSKEHPGGANDNQGSAKLVDDNLDSKFYLGSYTSDFWAMMQFSQPQIITSYIISTGDDEDGRDPQNFELVASNDNANWVSLDVQSFKKFSTRKASYRFAFTNTTAYTYYRLKIKSVKSSNSMQLSEWKLFKN